MNHVVMLIPGLDPIGGAERQLILLAQGLQRRGWRVSVVALSGTGGEAARELSRQGINFHSLRMSHSLCDPRGWLRWIWWLRRERPEIVHAHLPHAIWMARWSRLLMPVRVQIDTLHTPALGPWTPEAVLEEIRKAAQTTPFNGRIPVENRPDLAHSDHNGLFASGTLGRYSRILNSVVERRLDR